MEILCGIGHFAGENFLLCGWYVMRIDFDQSSFFKGKNLVGGILGVEGCGRFLVEGDEKIFG